MQIAGTIEQAEPNKEVAAEIKKDVSPVEAQIVDTPETVNVLEEYNFYLEQDNLATYQWDNRETRGQMRTVYVLNAEGKPEMDGNIPQMKGPGTEHDLLDKLFKSAIAQQEKLNSTRAELKKLHGRLREIVDELNNEGERLKNSIFFMFHTRER